MVNNNVLHMVRGLMVAATTSVALQPMIAHADNLGKTVTNIATLSFGDEENSKRVSVLTNAASFVIEAERTESTIEFFRHSPKAPDANVITINGSDFSTNGEADGPFIGVNGPGPSFGLGGVIGGGTQGTEIPVVPASQYYAGETMFVRVVDLGQNGDKNRIETVTINLTGSTGDTVTLRLYETGPDTGEFWGFIESTRDATNPNDNLFTTVQGTELTATYIDSFDATEVSIDTALVDPLNSVFNGLTGDFVDNARITLIDASTGQPALVYGIDGFSQFPSTIDSGMVVSDSSGFDYTLREGEFQFPSVPAGDYIIQVEPPKGLSFASALTPSDFVGLPNAPFDVLPEASYGLRFTQDVTGPLRFDIPLDAESNFVLDKTASMSIGDVGDFIGYKISVENRGDANALATLRDTIPQGFRYVAGSAYVDGQAFADPQISENGRDLLFKLGAIDTGASVNLSYALQIGSNIRDGEAVNSIVAIDGNGASASNIARAGVTIREDLFRSRGTLLGRIAENACDGDEEWSREIREGQGVAGVRLYMETGAYALTDQDGLYHFEGIKTGTHVVQVDEATLPKGYEVMVCEENSRYAGNAASKFVEINAGGLWRANFYLEKTGVTEDEKEARSDFNDQTEYKDFDREWLGTQTADIDWAYPATHRTPSIPSTNIGIKHGPNQKVELSLNGRPVPVQNFAARDADNARKVFMSRWRGVDLLEGRNNFVATVKSADGRIVKSLQTDIHYVTNIARASAMPDQSVLVADGRTHPEFAIRLEDEAGRPVHAGRIATIDVAAPYRLYNESAIEGADELVSPLSGRGTVNVGSDGIARVKLDPTLQTGKVSVTVTLDDGRRVPLFMYLEPEQRDWILVGLAEGSAAFNSVKDNLSGMSSDSAEDLITDGRAAFFAKGLVKGDWLLTLAVDTDKRRGRRDSDFQAEIDPNAYYTLYGDRSYSEFEAQSRYPVYVKLEKKSFYAMFGDFDTNITEGELTRYSRRLTGIKSEYLGEKFQATAFAAETNQGFAKDEIAADGTSGPYHLSNDRVLVNSESITIETRDRVRPDRILESRRLLRHLDYTIDSITGEIIFRLPVDVSDASFNPNVIVVDYETEGDAERNTTFGGRVQKQVLGGKVQIGSTFVHEGGDDSVVGGSSDMIGIDLVAEVGTGTEVRAEYAVSRSKNNELGSESHTSKAYLAEIVHTSERLTADAFIREEDGGFGLGQQGSNTRDIRRIGANVAYKIQELENEETGRRGSRNVSASVYHEENLGTGATRRSSEVQISQETQTVGGSLGLRQVKDNFETGESRESLLATASARYSIPKHGATFQVSHEQPISGNDDVADHPQRTRLSVTKTITKKATVQISHDILNGENTGGQNTAIGVSYQPWAGTQINAGSDMISQDSGRRIGATVGLDQQFKLNEKWSASVGVSNRQVLNQSGPIEQVAPDNAVSPLENNDSYTAAYAGVGYRNDATSASLRFEAREAKTENSYTVSAGGAREVTEELSFAGAMRANRREFRVVDAVDVNTGASGGVAKRADARLGLAWRPRDEDTIVLNRFDLSMDETIVGDKTVKLVNNLATNTRVTDRWQLSTQYGVKYVETTLGGQTYSGVSHLLGAETRFDITERIDIGLNGSVLIQPGTGTKSYQYGPSIGISPIDNVWISAGYNVEGFIDNDFQAAEYSRDGAYIKFRVKFDQNSARGLLDIISPKN